MKTVIHRRGEVHLGDLIRALGELPWKDDLQAAKIAESLGFTLRQHNQKQARNKSARNRDISHKTSKPPETVAKRPSVSTPPAPIQLPDAIMPGLLKEQHDLQPPPSSILQPDSQFEHYDENKYPAVTQPSLIPNNTARGIFTALLQTSRASRAINIRKLIRQSSGGLPPKHLPYLQTGTLEHGCQLLLDYSDSMVPWRDDIQSLTHQLENVVGKDSVTVFKFKALVLEAEHWAADMEPQQWQPVPQVPVLVATDFNLPMQQSEFRLETRWENFIQQCEKAASPLIFLIPWEYDAWLEKTVGTYPYLFPWSPLVTANRIKSLIGTGHG